MTLEDYGHRAVARAERVTIEGAGYEIIEVDIDGSQNDGQTLEILRKNIKKYGADTSLRMILRGNISKDYRPDTRRLTQQLSEGLEYLEIKDGTLPLLDAESYENDQTVIGELFRTLKEKMLTGDERQRAMAAMRRTWQSLDNQCKMTTTELLN